ncbi:Hypothetical_protein [Hexamita inflata]|uniref:Hypothetical_protein n=1 Tax=Hexamita inflata TaxID=28002 RepID=A0AA86U1G7_9EUKA|nr:Hypothetical protein HINF_LOCUS22427 [Hexamita inflata]
MYQQYQSQQYQEACMAIIVLRYNGIVYEKSMNRDYGLLPKQTLLPCSGARQRRSQAALHQLDNQCLHKGTIATKYGQRDRQATGRRVPRAPPGFEGGSKARRRSPRQHWIGRAMDRT